MSKSYYEMLKDPRWQRRRLEIMQRAEFKCEHCGNEEKTLNIHHAYYEKGLAPWEYPDESLHCLCEDCHKEAQDWNTLIQRQLGKIGAGGDLQTLFGYLKGLEAAYDPSIVIDVVSFEMAMGLANFFEIDVDMILGNLHDRCIDGHKLKDLDSKDW